MESYRKNESIMSDLLQIKKKSYSSVTKGKPILVTGRRKVPALTSIIVDGIDQTPKPLNQCLFKGGKERQLSVYEVALDRHGAVDHKTSRSTSISAFKTQSTVRFKADFDKLAAEIGGSPIGASISYGSNITDLVYTPELSFETEDSESLQSTEVSEADEPAKMESKKLPTHISLILSETETFFLLDIPSSTSEKDTEEGNIFWLKITELGNNLY